MATSYNYTTFCADLVSMTEEQGAEFAAFLSNIIALAEDKVLRDLDLELFDVSATSTFGVASPWLAKPTDMVGLRTMHYTNAAGEYVLLEPRSWAAVKDYWPNVTSTTSTPRYFTEYSDEDWFIAGTPASALVVTIRYIKRPDGLTSTNTTTWLSLHVGDLLLYAALVVSEQFLKADERISVWKDEYKERLVAAKDEIKPETRTDYMPLTAIPTKE